MKLCESTIRAEIAYYEQKAKEVGEPVTRDSASLRLHYLGFARRRRQLLAAFLDGRPERWKEYPDRAVDGAGGAPGNQPVARVAPTVRVYRRRRRAPASIERGRIDR